jgi:hypothetical protein
MRLPALQRWTLWLLPLLVARLFVADGFMVSATEQGVRVALCPAYAPMPGVAHPDSLHVHHAGTDHSAHQAAGHHAGQGAGHQDHDRSICAFALAGTHALCSAAPSVAQLYILSSDVPVARTQPAWTSPAVLIDRIRGPPLA